MNRLAYKETSVSIERSQSAIRELLRKYGAGGLQFNEDFAKNSIILRFSYSVNGSEAGPTLYFVRLQAQVPAVKQIRGKYTMRKRSQAAIDRELDQNHRAAWRAVYYALKSRMESITYGIETFEEAFLAHFEAGIGPEGRPVTIGERIIPRLREGQLALTEGTQTP